MGKLFQAMANKKVIRFGRSKEVAKSDSEPDPARPPVGSDPGLKERLDRLEAGFEVLEQALVIKEKEVSVLRSIISNCPDCSGLLNAASRDPPPNAPPKAPLQAPPKE